VEGGGVITNREWWRIQLGLLRCLARLLAAVVTRNEAAIVGLEPDIDALHERWAALSPGRRAARDRWLNRDQGGDD
jgi:hypothetical protein